MFSAFHCAISALTPRNILKATLAITSAVSRKSWQLLTPDLARNSSISRIPML